MSDLKDSSGSQADLYGGQSYAFTSDRFCNINSALYFNTGHVKAPSSYYFTGDFSITAWIYLNSYQSDADILSFTNGNDAVIFRFVGVTAALKGSVHNATVSTIYIATSAIIQLNMWYHVAFVLSGTTGYIYVNGQQMATGPLLVPSNVIRNLNSIGSNNFNGKIDELSIYQGAITLTQQINLYTASSANGIHILIDQFLPNNIFRI